MAYPIHNRRLPKSPKASINPSNILQGASLGAFYECL
jgi:hypothetical protein